MGQAYTPGLTVTDGIRVLKERRLPLKGNVLVYEGQKILAEDIVARAELPGDVHSINLASIFGIPPGEVPSKVLKKIGEQVKIGEKLAESKGFLGLFNNKCISTYEGTIKDISEKTGQMYIAAPKKPIEVSAYVDGIVSKIIKDEGVVIETYGAFIQGIMGVGSEKRGVLELIVSNPEEEITENMLEEKHKGKIIVGGSFIDYATLKKAQEIGCEGIVVGGISNADLTKHLGYEIGVAITGSEPGITLILTESFGKMTMAERTFELLSKYNNKMASINGATQIRAGVLRPEIIISYEGKGSREFRPPTDLDTGVKARIIRNLGLGKDSHFGEICTVVELPTAHQELATGSKTTVAVVEIEKDGKKQRINVARANLELLQG